MMCIYILHNIKRTYVKNVETYSVNHKNAQFHQKRTPEPIHQAGTWPSRPRGRNVSTVTHVTVVVFHGVSTLSGGQCLVY